MSKDEFENYLALLGRLLRLSQSQTESIGNELRDHMESRVGELTDNGMPPNDAVRLALEEFGDAASLAAQFKHVSNTHKRRWMMRFATLSVAGLFFAILLAFAMWPQEAHFGSPERAVAQNDPSATLPTTDAEANASDAPPLGPETTKTLPSVATRLTEDIRSRLKNTVTLEYEEQPFADIKAELESILEINISLDPLASLTENEPITVMLRDVPCDYALRLLLSEKNATYTIQSGVVRIISLDDELDSQFLVRKVFDVDDLLASIAAWNRSNPTEANNHKNPPTADNTRLLQTQTVGSTTQTGRDAASSGGVNSNRPPANHSHPGLLLTELIYELVSPDEWNHTDGGPARLSLVCGQLVVYGPERLIGDVDEFLTDLRSRVVSN